MQHIRFDKNTSLANIPFKKLNSFTANIPTGTNADFGINSAAVKQLCSIHGPCLNAPYFHNAFRGKGDSMLLVPRSLYAQYAAHLKLRGIPVARHAEYKKWLRYFLDFCNKYAPPGSNSQQVRLFCEKLRDKLQSETQRKEAAHAISLFLEMQQPSISADPDGNEYSEKGKTAHDAVSMVNESPGAWMPSSDPASLETRHPSMTRSASGYTEAGYQVLSDSPEWDDLLAKLADEIKVRHYSRKTLKTYANWSRQFQRFLKNKPPAELSTVDVKD